MLSTGTFTGVNVMDNFRVVVWCEACRGDDEGCFGGLSGVLEGHFESREEADRAGAHYCAALPYRYRVEQIDRPRTIGGSGETHQFSVLA
jgi:hypothetical protein